LTTVGFSRLPDPPLCSPSLDFTLKTMQENLMCAVRPFRSCSFTNHASLRKHELGTHIWHSL